MILILSYLTIKIGKESFHDDYTITYNVIKDTFKELYNSNKLEMNGSIFSMGKKNLPSTWTEGGIRTHDIYASGTIGIGDDNGNIKAFIKNDGSASFCGGLITIDANGRLIIRNKNNNTLKTSFFQSHDRFMIGNENGSYAIGIYNGDDGNYQNYILFPYVNKWFGRDNR